MAEFYKTVFTGSFCDDKSGNNIVISIQRRYPTDIGVIPTEIMFSGTEREPVSISYPDQGDYKLTPINGCECVVNIKAVDDFEIASIYPTDEREYRLNVTSSNYAFRGYILPDNCTEPFMSKPYDVTIRATDSLGTLENEPFLSSGGVRYTGFMRDDVLIRTILAKTGLLLNLNIAVNTSEDQMVPAICPMSQIYADTARFYDEDGNPYNCKDVLESVLRRWGARLHQWKGEWYVVNALELSQGAVYTWRFDSNGNDLPTTFIGDLVYAGGDDRAVRPVGNTFLAKAVQSATAFYEYGYTSNELFNGDFDLWSGIAANLPTGWGKNGTPSTTTQYRIDPATGATTTDVFVTINNNNPGGGSIYNTNLVQIRANETANVSFDLYSSAALADIVPDKAIDVLIWDSTNNMYFTENNGWQPTAAFYRIKKPASDFRNQITVNIDVTPKSVDYQMEIGLRAVTRANDTSTVFATSVNNASIRQSVSSGLAKPATGSINTQKQTVKQTFQYDSILMLHADETNSLRTSRLSVGSGTVITPTVSWDRAGFPGEGKSLQHIVANTELIMHARPYRMFDAEFKGSGYLGITDRLSIDLATGTYMFMSGKFNLKSGVHQLKWAECLTTNPPFVEEVKEYYGQSPNGETFGSPGSSTFSSGGSFVDLSGYAKTVDVPVKASNLETQGGTNDAKFVTPLTLANWWSWVKGQLQTVSAVWNFTARPTFNGVGLITAADIPKGSDNMLSKSASYTVVLADFGSNGNCTVFVDTTSGNVPITLPSAADMNGYTLNIIKTSADTNSVVVTATINGLANDLLSNQYDAGTYKSNGTSIFKF